MLSVIPDAARISWPPLLNVGLPAKVRLTASSAALYDTEKRTGLLTVLRPFLVDWSTW